VKRLGPRPAPGGDGGAFPAARSGGRAPAGRCGRARDCAYHQRIEPDATVGHTVWTDRSDALGLSAQGHRGTKHLYPAAAVVSLAPDKYSHGLQQIAAKAAVQGSFDAAVEALAQTRRLKSIPGPPLALPDGKNWGTVSIHP